MLVEWLASSDLSMAVASLAVNAIIMIDVQCFRRLMGEYSGIILRTCKYIFYIFNICIFGVYICINICIRIRTYLPAYLHTYLSTTYMHANIHEKMYIDVHTRTYRHIHVPV